MLLKVMAQQLNPQMLQRIFVDTNRTSCFIIRVVVLYGYPIFLIKCLNRIQSSLTIFHSMSPSISSLR